MWRSDPLRRRGRHVSRPIDPPSCGRREAEPSDVHLLSTRHALNTPPPPPPHISDSQPVHFPSSMANALASRPLGRRPRPPFHLFNGGLFVTVEEPLFTFVPPAFPGPFSVDTHAICQRQRKVRSGPVGVETRRPGQNRAGSRRSLCGLETL